MTHYDPRTRQEYDTRRTRFGWNVNDDHGRNHYGPTLRLAVWRAYRRNRKGDTQT